MPVGCRVLYAIAFDEIALEYGGVMGSDNQHEKEASGERLGRLKSVIRSYEKQRDDVDAAFGLKYLSDLLDEYGVGRDKSLVASIVQHSGNYWRNGIMLILASGAQRPGALCRIFNALDPGHPISRKILNMNLRLLERDGLIHREEFEDEWNHVEYTVTELGQEFAEHIKAMVEWIARKGDSIRSARMNYDAQHSSDCRSGISATNR